jgi:hypothetical protein
VYDVRTPMHWTVEANRLHGEEAKITAFLDFVHHPEFQLIVFLVFRILDIGQSPETQ